MGVRQPFLCITCCVKYLTYKSLGIQISKSLQHAYILPPRPVFCTSLQWQHRAEHIIPVLNENLSTPQFVRGIYSFYWCSPSSFLRCCNVPLNPKVLLFASHSVSKPSIIDKTKPFTLLLMEMCNVGAMHSHKFPDTGGLAISSTLTN